jgi:hypothetical protein
MIDSFYISIMPERRLDATISSRHGVHSSWCRQGFRANKGYRVPQAFDALSTGHEGMML